MSTETRVRLAEGGLWALEHAGDLPGPAPAPPRDPLFRLWVHSPQGNDASWTLLAPRRLVEGGSPVVREVVWSRRHDEEQLDSDGERGELRRRGEPSLRVRDLEISAWDQDNYRDIVESLRAPTPAVQSRVSVGDRYGIQGYGPLASLRMEWQGAGPVEWSEPIRRVTNLRNLMIDTGRTF